MACLKCGRETGHKEVFCSGCLRLMEACDPIKPGTKAVIHQRPKSEHRPPVHRQVKPEEIIARLHRRVHRLWVALIILALLLAASAGALGCLLHAHYSKPELGSNYSTAPTETQSTEHIDTGALIR